MNLKNNLIPIGVAAIVFMIVVALMQPSPTVKVLVASQNISAGHVIAESDVTLESLPEDIVPTDALTSADQAVGQTVSMDRTSGDMILASQLGEAVQLQSNERAISIEVDDASGMAGLLKAGDYVGVTAIITKQGSGNEGAFSKVTVENLRVLYLSPTFKAVDTTVSDTEDTSDTTASADRSSSGAVVLAVPVDMKVIQYDFSTSEYQSPSQSRTVSAIELLAALNATSNATLSLYMMPRDATEFQTSGLWLSDLVITPGPTPTPTETLSPSMMNEQLLATPLAPDAAATPTAGQ